MSTLFVKHFNKTAGVAASIAKRFASLPGWAQTGLGVGGAAALSEGEHHILDSAGLTSKDPGTNSLQRLVTHGLNLTMLGVPYGNARLRRDTFAFKDPGTGLPLPGTFDTSKGISNFSKKILAAPALSAGINLATATGDIKEMTGQIGGLVENITGLKPGETPADASARRAVEGLFNQQADPAKYVADYKVPPASGNPDIAKGVEKAFAALIAKHPDQATALAAKRDQYLGHYQALAEHDMNSRDIWKTVSGIGETVGNLKQVSVDAGAGLERALEKSDEFSEILRQGLGKVDKVTDLSEKGMTKIDQGVGNLTRNLGFAAAGAGAIWGGYNLLRDYLNYNRIKKEREARAQGVQPKLAALPWGKTITALGSILGGGFAYNNAQNTGLSDSESILPVAVGTISGGLAGRGLANARAGNSTYAKAMVPVSTTLANDMYGAPLWAMMKGKIHEQKADAATRPFSNAALGVGGGALTVAALAALYQGARAAKRISEGQPLVNATTSNTILSGSGGPDNPNYGGKMLVTLPTRNPGDRETTIELPLENVPLSDTLINKIRRDTKRRLRTESDTRTLRDDDRSPERIKQLMAVS